MSQTVLLGDIAGINAHTIGKQYRYEIIYYLDVASVDQGQVKEKAKLVLRDAPSRAKRIVKDNDILISTVRPNLKHFAYIEKAEPNLVASTGFTTISGSESVDSKYLYYFLTSDPITEYLTAVAESQTSTFPAFRPEILSELEINLPSMDKQKEIGGFLYAIDQKIKLNRRMNETLEQMGQALFKHYFIDNPQAKTWPKINIGDHINLKGGGTPSTEDVDFWDGELAWTSPRDLTGKSDMYLLATNKKITQKGLAKISSGLLPEGTLLLSSRAPIGYVAIAGMPLAINQGYIAFTPSGNLPNSYMYFWLKYNMDRIKGAANGSTFMEISKTVFRSIESILPPNNLVVAFDQEVKAVLATSKNNQIEATNLSKLRDLLLPGLISGKVKV